jgi:sugar/nucleoside kinase (ribokinase family)
VLYLEGYLWDQPRAKEAMRNAAIAAQKAGVKVAFTLSDSFCVARYRAEFLELVDKHVDILFANEHEILSLYEVENFDDALQKVRGHCEIRALTRSERAQSCSRATRCTSSTAVPG